MPQDIASALKFEYGKNQWWGSSIQSYDCMKLALKKQGLEQNHLVHAAFFRKGPPEVHRLVGYVPCLTLSMEEHRGPKYSYHKMKDGQKVGTGRDTFEGCGMDAFLLGEGIDVNAKSYTMAEVAKALDASIRYWDRIGIRHAAAALREFKTCAFDPIASGG